MKKLEQTVSSKEAKATSLAEELRVQTAKLAQQASEISELKKQQREGDKALSSK